MNPPMVTAIRGYRITVVKIAAVLFLLCGITFSFSPRLSATGDVIVFSSGLDVLGGTLGQLFGSEEHGGIYAVRPDGTGLRQLTSFQTLNFRYQPDIFDLPDDHPFLSPDGRKILFTSSRADDGGVLSGIGETDNFEVFIMDVNGTNIRRLTFNPFFDGEASFSPDGTKIVFTSECAGLPFSQCLDHPNIFIMDLNGNLLQRVTNSPFSDIEATWTPDGKQIVYTRVTDEGTFIFGDEQKQIRVTDADGTNKNDRLLFDRANQDHDPSVRPNGTEVAITSELAGTFPYGDVVRIKFPSGGFVANLTVDDTFLGIGGGGGPVWSPDGSKIAYIKAFLGILRGPQKIHIMNADGSGKRRLDGLPGTLNIHQKWGVLADSDGDGTPDYLENGNTSFSREAVTGFGLFGQQVGIRSQAGEQFGAAIALADLNHDGRLDLIVGSPGLDEAGLISNSGGVAIVLGTQYGPQFAPTLAESLSTVLERLAAIRPGPTTNGHFGQTMVSGDFNGDGFTDVAIGAPGQNKVVILYGGSSSQVLTGSGEFGAALAAGDFNNDGKADLAVGAPSEERPITSGPGVVGSGPAGAVRIFFGSPSGLGTTPQIIDQGSLPVAVGIGKQELGDRFGAALAAGDIDGDFVPDLAIGVPNEDIENVIDAGLVHVVPGKTGQQLQTSLAVHRDARSLSPPFGSLTANAEFGSVLAIGRFRSASGPTNLIVGVPAEPVSGTGKTGPTTVAAAGIVAVFEGRSPLLLTGDRVSTTATVWTAETLGSTVQPSGRFGQTLAVGDFTGDGVKDLAIGAPGQAAGGFLQAGMVFIVPGNIPSSPFIPLGAGGGLLPSSAQRLDQSNVGTKPESNDHFGGSLIFPSANTLAAGDMDGDGQDELFIGTPEEDGGSADTGLVSIRYGINVGTFALEPMNSALRHGGAIAFDLTWTHPAVWTDLESIDLRIVNDDQILFWVRFDVAQNVLTLIDENAPAGEQSGEIGSHGKLHSGMFTLDLNASALITSGPQGRSLILHLPLRLEGPPIPSGSYRIEVFATDVHGNSQGFSPAGRLTITKSGKSGKPKR